MSATTSPSTTSDPTQTALLAVQTLFQNPDNEEKKRANEWLSEFQHTSEAWQTCHAILTSPEAPTEARMMAAQTLRSKVVYDLDQLPKNSLPALRDSFLQSLQTFSSPSAPQGSRTIVTQLCLALADLAFQMPEWKNVVQEMTENFGTRAECVEMLLEFLKCLVEESENSRIPISNAEAKQRSGDLLTSQSRRILELLTMYVNAEGVTPRLHSLVFDTLRSWLQAGELDVNLISQSPLFAFAFESLSNISLFDSAVEVVCDMIHETQEVHDNVGVVQLIVPRVIGLGPSFRQAVANEDDDAVRGFCRIFTEAGEIYRQLILQHAETFVPLVELLGECAAYHDLDIVPITFDFWWKLAEALAKEREKEENSLLSTLTPLLALYSKLQASLTLHLRFPEEESSQTAEQRDDFRAFRHRMGDTLKDCCSVLGADVCMKTAYDSVMAALQRSATWQEIEAPLFSIRAMGAKVDPSDEHVLPLIMDMLPNLPRHPRIQYAAILVISRYTHWIAAHPQYLPFQLGYISEGFNIQEADVSLAAALAMKFMCQDCQEHLVPYLGQLHSFVTTAGLGLTNAEKMDVAEAIGFVIGSMSESDAAAALEKFTQPLLEQLQEACVRPLLLSRDELEPIIDVVQQLQSYIINITPLQSLPPTCTSSPAQIWQVIEALLGKYSSSYGVADHTTRLLRKGATFFPWDHMKALLPQMFTTSLASFDSSGHSCYIWLVERLIWSFGSQLQSLSGTPEAAELEAAIGNALERMTTSVKSFESQQGAVNIPDVIEDYVHAVETYLKKAPAVILQSPSLPLVFDLTLTSLDLPSPGAVMAGLETIVQLFEAGTVEGSPYTAQLAGAAGIYGQKLVSTAMKGLVTDYVEESQDAIIDILKELLKLCPAEARTWTLTAVEALPGHIAPAADKRDFYANFEKVFAQTNLDLVKNAMRIFFRSTRRAKDRKDRLRTSLGGGGR